MANEKSGSRGASLFLQLGYQKSMWRLNLPCICAITRWGYTVDKVQDRMKSIGAIIFWIIFILGPTGANTRVDAFSVKSNRPFILFANIIFLSYWIENITAKIQERFIIWISRTNKHNNQHRVLLFIDASRIRIEREIVKRIWDHNRIV